MLNEWDVFPLVLLLLVFFFCSPPCVVAGEYLALTGTRLQAPDMLATGLATHGVPSSRVGELEERLCALAAPDASSIDAAIKEFEDRTSLGEPTVVPK